MTWLTHEVGAAQMRAAARRGLPPDPSHRSGDPCPWGLCPEDEWTRTTGYSGGASTAPDRARMTIQTTNTDRLRAIGVVTDGTHGPFIDPDKVLALAARVAAPSDALDEQVSYWRSLYETCLETTTRMARAAAPSDGLREVERALRNAYGDVADVWPHFFAVRAALAATPTEDRPVDPGGLREDIESLRTTAREQMDAAGALGSGAFFEGQVYAYDEVLRRILAAATPTDD
jgi:hypothetical protein